MIRIKQLRHRFVDLIPDDPEPGILYVSMEYATAAHRCCCGCGEEVVTPFNPAQWQMSFDGDAVSLHPSVGNWNLRCRSHYVVRDGRVIEAPTWTKEEVDAGRRRDANARADYFGDRKTGPAPTEIPAPAAKPEKGLWRRLRGWLNSMFV
ncbi:DUF6527 family protein [Bradyrhizobium sp. RT5a]|uniref:DUF6527 family protein n=1 Tax=Bradyrhizobium sp. RT5a TaxID=3156380 RepID=UPI00339208D0